MNILIVEDDLPLGLVLQQALERERHTVKVARDGEHAMSILAADQFQLILLDLRLPKMDGSQVLQRLRNQNIETPVLVVSGCGGVEERVRALDSGADDFLQKPFSLMELTARVRALTRRSRPAAETTMQIADLIIDRLEGSAERAGREIDLTSREYCLLEFLALNHGRPISRTRILSKVWGSEGESTSNIVDVYINYLRRKIDAGSVQKLVHTIRGVGYCLAEKAPDPHVNRELHVAILPAAEHSAYTITGVHA